MHSRGLKPNGIGISSVLPAVGDLILGSQNSMVYGDMNDQVRDVVLSMVSVVIAISYNFSCACFIGVEECMKQERDRVSSYLQSRSQHKLLQVFTAFKTSFKKY
ncbi:hypothetical protein RHGRI_003274 [Rhododendron griersonianum]|uniref:Uncharacterized protein n=1 Tax=Rhododendron griersonianum TaxID=479676 RepID=A0AAV6L6A9_9ERIC|nr:hypothetical protein RHGRI_003274 [Rhododendron griersonianum]